MDCKDPKEAGWKWQELRKEHFETQKLYACDDAKFYTAFLKKHYTTHVDVLGSVAGKVDQSGEMIFTFEDICSTSIPPISSDTKNADTLCTLLSQADPNFVERAVQHILNNIAFCKNSFSLALASVITETDEHCHHIVSTPQIGNGTEINDTEINCMFVCVPESVADDVARDGYIVSRRKYVPLSLCTDEAIHGYSKYYTENPVIFKVLPSSFVTIRQNHRGSWQALTPHLPPKYLERV